MQHELQHGPKDGSYGARSVACLVCARWPVLSAVLAVVFLSNLLFTVFVASERTLYGADHVAYWAMSAGVADGLATRPVATVGEVVESVATRELNLLPTLPPAAFMLLFGSSRTAYVLAVLNLYALPAIFLAALLVHRTLPRVGELSPLVSLWAVVVASLLLPAYWWPVSLGYLGVGGVLLCFSALLVHFGSPAGSRSVLRMVGLGAALALLFLFRRWYAFWSLSFIVMMAADGVAQLWLQRPVDRHRAWSTLRQPMIVAASAAVALAAAAGPMLWHVLRTDYADRFAFYKTHASASAEMWGALGYLGVVGVAGVVIAAVVLIWTGSGRRVALLLVVLLLLSALLFRRVQDPSPQHWYLLLPSLLPIIAGGLVWALDRCPSSPARLAFGVGVSVLAAGHLAAVCILPRGRLAPVVASVRFEPQRREDLDEVTRLLGFLDRRLAQRPGSVYVLGATTVLNDTALAFANLSLGTTLQSPRFLVQSAHVDRRDGFPTGLLEARYAVVSDPVQCRQPPTEQWVIELPARQILDGRGIGAAFGRHPQSFRFDNGVEVFVYERMRASTADEIAELSRELVMRYPARPEIWKPAD